MVAGCLLAGGWFFKKTGFTEERGVLGGPAPSSGLVQSAEGAEFDSNTAGVMENGANALLAAGSGSDLSSGPQDAIPNNAITADGTALQDVGVAVGPAFDRSGTVSYTVRSGDNLSSIASYFGISINTIINANPGVRTNSLRVGQTLSILPTSGVVYHAKSGDTLSSLAGSFGIPESKLVQFNRSVDFSSLDPGTPIIIPGGTQANLAAVGSANLPNYNSKFIMPTNGYNWGTLHHYNAVDIANSCGTPVVAAAEGVVVPDENIPDAPNGWNEGYGNFVLIEHPFGNNVMTRYAHLEKILVNVGDYVQQGEEIGLMGETGDATGCHVHFEVIGAQNPFAKS